MVDDFLYKSNLGFRQTEQLRITQLKVETVQHIQGIQKWSNFFLLALNKNACDLQEQWVFLLSRNTYRLIHEMGIVTAKKFKAQINNACEYHHYCILFHYIRKWKE